ncbi:MAG TPA: SRPBCC family protein [Candidatus Eisenbacteria bacterium]|nr:SRPBCC family protein [Candidatus Eisenbacteria bacterium]
MPALVAFLVGPVAIAAFVRVLTSGGPWSPLWQLWIVALIVLFAATWFLDRAEKLKAAHIAAGYIPLRALQTETQSATVGIALAVIAEFVLVASFELLLGVVLIGLLAVWILVGFLPPMRRHQGRSSIEVACTRESAFALVSDPHSWRLWTPELELVEMSETPVRLGTIVYSRMRIGGRPLEARERVAVFDPPVRCGSEILDAGGTGLDLYEIAATESGTLVTYTFRSVLPPTHAILGGTFRNYKFTERWRKKMLRIKELLEEGSAGSV